MHIRQARDKRRLRTVGAFMMASLLAAYSYGQSQATPPTATQEWPPYVQDADSSQEGDQPGRDTEAPNPNADPSRHTKGERQVRIHIKPGTTEDGEDRLVCDAHFLLPPGVEPSSNEGKVAQTSGGQPVWKHKPGKNSYHFYSENCEPPMWNTGLTFTFWASAKSIKALQECKIVLTNDGKADLPPKGPAWVAVLRETSDGKPIHLPVQTASVIPAQPQNGVLDGYGLVTLGEAVSLSLSTTDADADFHLYMAQELDADGSDPSGSGLAVQAHPVPPSWGVTFVGGAEQWVNSEGQASRAVEFGWSTELRGKTIWVAASYEPPSGMAYPSGATRFYVIHSEQDYDGDGALNVEDVAPLDPAIQ